VFVLDFTRKEDLSRLVEEVANLIKRQVPIRFGIVALPVDGDVDGERHARIFYHLIESYGRAVAMKFAEDLLERYDKNSITKTVKSLYTDIYQKSTILSGHEKIPYDELMKVASTEVLKNTRSWANRLGINAKEGAIFGNGQVFLKDDTWVNKIGTGLTEDVQMLQKAIYAAEISEDDDILEYLFKDAPKRRNQYIFPAESADIKYINLVNVLSEKGIIYVPGETHDEQGDRGVETSTVIWVVDDFDSYHGTELIKEAASFQSKHPHVTLGLVHNPGSTTGPPNLSLMLYYLVMNGLLDDKAGIERFRQLLQEVDLTGLGTGDEMDKILGVKAASWRTIDTEKATQFWKPSRSFIQDAGFKPGDRGIVINGRVQ
jgi:UDP-glucose:glycoprotein glucosyltransferase